MIKAQQVVFVVVLLGLTWLVFNMPKFVSSPVLQSTPVLESAAISTPCPTCAPTPCPPPTPTACPACTPTACPTCEAPAPCPTCAPTPCPTCETPTPQPNRELETFLATYSKGKAMWDKWKVASKEADRKWEYKVSSGTMCNNVGHFFLEHFPNILHFRRGIKKVCCPSIRPSVQDLVNELVPGLVWGGKDECNEEGSPTYSCFMSWACEPGHQHLLLDRQEYWNTYDAIFGHCDIKSVPITADVLLMNRDGGRYVVNYDALEARLHKEGKKTITITTKEISTMKQCDIFRFYAQAQLIIMPYGADQLYPLLLQKRLITLMHKQASEGFWDSSRHQLGKFAPYKTLSVIPYKNNTVVEEKHGYNMYSFLVYSREQLFLTEDHLNDLIIIVKRMLK